MRTMTRQDNQDKQEQQKTFTVDATIQVKAADGDQAIEKALQRWLDDYGSIEAFQEDDGEDAE